MQYERWKTEFFHSWCRIMKIAALWPGDLDDHSDCHVAGWWWRRRPLKPWPLQWHQARRRRLTEPQARPASARQRQCQWLRRLGRGGSLRLTRSIRHGHAARASLNEIELELRRSEHRHGGSRFPARPRPGPPALAAAAAADRRHSGCWHAQLENLLAGRGTNLTLVNTYESTGVTSSSWP